MDGRCALCQTRTRCSPPRAQLPLSRRRRLRPSPLPRRRGPRPSTIASVWIWTVITTGTHSVWDSEAILMGLWPSWGARISFRDILAHGCPNVAPLTRLAAQTIQIPIAAVAPVVRIAAVREIAAVIPLALRCSGLISLVVMMHLIKNGLQTGQQTAASPLVSIAARAAAVRIHTRTAWTSATATNATCSLTPSAKTLLATASRIRSAALIHARGSPMGMAATKLGR